MFILRSEVKIGDVLIAGLFSSLVIYEVIGITKSGAIRVKEFNQAYWKETNVELFNTRDIVAIQPGDDINIKYVYNSYFYLLRRK